jgi:hypothetical protein
VSASQTLAGHNTHPCRGKATNDPLAGLVNRHTTKERLARWVLAASTLILVASMGGGFLLLPLLIPAHI